MSLNPYLLLLLISAAIHVISVSSQQQQQQPTGVSQNLWCVAKNNAEDSALQSAIDWACGTGGADCGPVQQGGACYDNGEDIRKTASYVFNNYCGKNGMTEETCNFANTAALTSLDPSFSSCKFPSSMEGKSTQGTTAVQGGGTSTADLTSNGFKVAYGGGVWIWCWCFIIIRLLWFNLV